MVLTKTSPLKFSNSQVITGLGARTKKLNPRAFGHSTPPTARKLYQQQTTLKKKMHPAPPHTNLNCRRHFFTMRVINHWNQLPTEIVSTKSVNGFKNRLKAYSNFPSKCKWSNQWLARLSQDDGFHGVWLLYHSITPGRWANGMKVNGLMSPRCHVVPRWHVIRYGAEFQSSHLCL